MSFNSEKCLLEYKQIPLCFFNSELSFHTPLYSLTHIMEDYSNQVKLTPGNSRVRIEKKQKQWNKQWFSKTKS